MPQYGDLVILASPRGKRHIYRIEEGHDLHTQDGVMRAADLAASEFGMEVRTAMGVPSALKSAALRPGHGHQAADADHVSQGHGTHLLQARRRQRPHHSRGRFRFGRLHAGAVVVFRPQRPRSQLRGARGIPQARQAQSGMGGRGRQRHLPPARHCRRASA